MCAVMRLKDQHESLWRRELRRAKAYNFFSPEVALRCLPVIFIYSVLTQDERYRNCASVIEAEFKVGVSLNVLKALHNVYGVCVDT